MINKYDNDNNKNIEAKIIPKKYNLIKREILNDKNFSKNYDNSNDSNLNPVKRKLISIDIEDNKDNNNDDKINNNNDENNMFDDVFSFEVYGANEIEEDKEEGGIKKSNIFNSKINLYLQKNSIEVQLVDRKIDLENKNDENGITNEIK